MTDGANDGGIDAIFNDPTSEGNDLIIVQSKFYENTALGTDNVAGELYKINETLKKLQSNKISEFKENQRIIAGNAQFTGIAAGRGVGFTTGLLLLREGLGMRETPIRPHSWH